jgi:hypothetical protein
MFAGSFSYKNNTINCFIITINGTLMHVRVKTTNVNVASIYVTDLQGTKVSMPTTVSLHDAFGINIVPHNDEFPITWANSYVLSLNGVESIWLTNQRQQALQAAPGITHFTV